MDVAVYHVRKLFFIRISLKKYFFILIYQVLFKIEKSNKKKTIPCLFPYNLRFWIQFNTIRVSQSQ